MKRKREEEEAEVKKLPDVVGVKVIPQVARVGPPEPTGNASGSDPDKFMRKVRISQTTMSR